MNGTEWNGYDLDRIDLLQNEIRQKIQIEKERLKSSLSITYATDGRTTSNITEMAMATSDALKMTRYGIRTVKTIKKIINIYNNLRN